MELKRRSLIALAATLFYGPFLSAQSEPTAPVASAGLTCSETLSQVTQGADAEKYSALCDSPARLPACASAEGNPILHFEGGSSKASAKRILVFATTHGDEPHSGLLALEWVKRLKEIDSRSFWRIVPVVNPDGLIRKTRGNARGVDLNRNFPTADWAKDAQKYWERTAAKNPRRFPGEAAASEPETKCAVDQIKDFKPDFVVSIHAPYGILDFDGPKVSFPKYKALPFKRLGNFPGSLGRYMWKDHGLPVLTVELGEKQIPDATTLQDVVGSVAIQAIRATAKTPKRSLSAADSERL